MKITFLCMLSFSLQSWLNIQGFTPCQIYLSHRNYFRSNLHSNPGRESQAEYQRRLIEAAKDPLAFEAFVRGQDSKDSLPNREKDQSFGDYPPNSKKVGKYQRIEEWDAEQSQESMSWENRVQNDGRKYGNAYLQNEILRKILKSF
jgi:hypothetical protein